MIRYAAAVVALSVCPCLGGELVHLGYKFDTGAPIRHELKQEMTQTQSMQGQTMESTSSTTTMVTTELIKANEDGSVVIATTPERMTMTISAPGMDLSYDSQKESDKSKLSDPTVASIAGMVGLEVRLLVASDGTILDVPNIDALQKAVDEMPDATVKSAIGPSVSKDALMASNEMNFKLLPEDAVEVGDSWTREFKIPMGFGDMTITLGMTLDAVKDGIADISIDGSLSMPEIKQQGMTMNLSGSSLAGSLRFNIEDGVQESYELDTSMKMDASMDGMGDAPVMSMNMDQHVQLHRVND